MRCLNSVPEAWNPWNHVKVEEKTDTQVVFTQCSGMSLSHTHTLIIINNNRNNNYTALKSKTLITGRGTKTKEMTLKTPSVVGP